MTDVSVVEIRTTGADIEPLLDPLGAEVLRYWNSLRPDVHAIPPKSAFDPMMIPKALPCLQIVEKRPEDGELVYRLVGTRLVRERGYDPTGMLVRDGFYGNSLERVLEDYEMVLESREPLFDVEIVRRPNQDPVRDTALFMPMEDDDGVARFVLVYSEQSYDFDEIVLGSY